MSINPKPKLGGNEEKQKILKKFIAYLQRTKKKILDHMKEVEEEISDRKTFFDLCKFYQKLNAESYNCQYIMSYEYYHLVARNDDWKKELENICKSAQAMANAFHAISTGDNTFSYVSIYPLLNQVNVHVSNLCYLCECHYKSIL